MNHYSIWLITISNENGKTKINRGINISFDLISNKLKTIIENTFFIGNKNKNIKNII